MWQRLKNVWKPKRCAICKKKAEKPTTYYNDQGESVPVCFKCVPYAERRAFRKG
ncbi:hypothetical protein SAMN05421676_11386 [Salinibacillus kushneri]|uniref:Uncharacterized protein n=1 Tax=Salinibacillus kushneri TaxID=237682 RepID=A0A1I0ISU8_9BACI|nr:hypothetical protein [Salinibacillus kushneri]SET99595.1 hypothetical protein SAMN05421676_11386 [Salinibacillus kushneri]